MLLLGDCQLRRVRLTLDAESAATLVHAFVASRVDYCTTVLAGAPKSLTDKLQRVLNTSARVVSSTQKHDHGLSELLHDELHWLDYGYTAASRLQTRRDCPVSTVVCSARLRHTWRISAHRSPISPVGSIYVFVLFFPLIVHPHIG